MVVEWKLEDWHHDSENQNMRTIHGSTCQEVLVPSFNALHRWICELVTRYWHRRETFAWQALERSQCSEGNNFHRDKCMNLWHLDCKLYAVKIPVSRSLGYSFLLAKGRTCTLMFKKRCLILEFLLFIFIVKNIFYAFLKDPEIFLIE